MNIFRRKRIAHPTAPQMYQMHNGDVFTPGVQSLVFEPTFSNPVEILAGAGKMTGALAVLQPPQVRQTLALPPSPMQGTPVAWMELQGLESSGVTTD